MSPCPDESEARVFRRAGISYLHIPAQNPQASASFYAGVFGWTVDPTRSNPSFEDGTGHVIGHFIADSAVAGEAGVRPYIYVESVDEALEQVSARGGAVAQAPYPEGHLWVATFHDRRATCSASGTGVRAAECPGSARRSPAPTRPVEAV